MQWPWKKKFLSSMYHALTLYTTKCLALLAIKYLCLLPTSMKIRYPWEWFEENYEKVLVKSLCRFGIEVFNSLFKARGRKEVRTIERYLSYDGGSRANDRDHYCRMRQHVGTTFPCTTSHTCFVNALLKSGFNELEPLQGVNIRTTKHHRAWPRLNVTSPYSIPFPRCISKHRSIRPYKGSPNRSHCRFCNFP